MVGSDYQWSLERIYIRHLRSHGLEAKLFAAQNLFLEHYNNSLLNKVVFKLGMSGILTSVNDRLMKTIEQFSPEVVWVFKGMEVLPETLVEIKKRGILLANYNPDNPFFFSGAGSGNRNVTRSIGLFDIHFSYDRHIRQRIIAEFGLPCINLPFGFELDEAVYQNCLQQKEIKRLGFIGNPDRQRIDFISSIADHFEVDVYGHGWDKALSHKRVSTFDAVYGNDYWYKLHSYRAQINLMRPHNPDSHNMRSFEIVGAGGIGLYPATSDHQEYFGNDHLAVLYKNMNDCVKSVEDLLHMDDSDALNWRKNIRLEALNRGFDYFSRAKIFIDAINSI